MEKKFIFFLIFICRDLSKPVKVPGRRNIRKVFDDEEITASTKQAGKEEESRVSRIIERQTQVTEYLKKFLFFYLFVDVIHCYNLIHV